MGGFAPVWGVEMCIVLPSFWQSTPPDRDSWNTLIALCCYWTHLSHFEMCAIDKKLCVHQSCICYYVSEWGKWKLAVKEATQTQIVIDYWCRCFYLLMTCEYSFTVSAQYKDPHCCCLGWCLSPSKVHSLCESSTWPEGHKGERGEEDRGGVMKAGIGGGTVLTHWDKGAL